MVKKTFLSIIFAIAIILIIKDSVLAGFIVTVVFVAAFAIISFKWDSDKTIRNQHRRDANY